MAKLNMIAAAAATAALALATPAFANSGTAATKAEQKVSENTKYCFDVEASTGTRIGKRVCQTKTKWAEEGIDVDRHMKR